MEAAAGPQYYRLIYRILLLQSEDEAAELIASTTDGVDTSRRAVSEVRRLCGRSLAHRAAAAAAVTSGAAAQMCFAEFLEAMARIALVVYPMPSVSLKASSFDACTAQHRVNDLQTHHRRSLRCLWTILPCSLTSGTTRPRCVPAAPLLLAPQWINSYSQ